MDPDAFLKVFEHHKKRHGDLPPLNNEQPLTRNPGKGGHNKPQDDPSEYKLVPYVDVEDEIQLRHLLEKLREIQIGEEMCDWGTK
ncbi:hypothetical protein BGZ93_007434 [Podila epicladia]|nr:hypothetical protein BGZ92_005717 [Podila epicladia]KAG0094255.1 hypothetical protein BGZ93_007434 [Podila epicladia]